MSLSFLNQDGIVKGDDDNYKRYSGMFNGSQKVNKWLKVGSSVQTIRPYSIQSTRMTSLVA